MAITLSDGSSNYSNLTEYDPPLAKNTTKSVIVGTDREEVLKVIQRGFENHYHLYGMLKRILRLRL